MMSHAWYLHEAYKDRSVGLKLEATVAMCRYNTSAIGRTIVTLVVVTEMVDLCMQVARVWCRGAGVLGFLRKKIRPEPEVGQARNCDKIGFCLSFLR